MAVGQLDSLHRLAHKPVIHQQRRPRLTRLPLSHQTSSQAADTTTRVKLRTISLLAQQAPLATHRSVRRLDLASRAQQLVLALANPTRELKPHLQERLTLELKHQMLARLTQLPVSHKLLVVQPDLQQQQDAHQLSVVKLDSDQLHKRQLLVDLDKADREVAAVVAHHPPASKTKARRATTRPFPENPKLTIRSSLKSLRLLSTATSKNSQVTTLTSKLVARSSTSAP